MQIDADVLRGRQEPGQERGAVSLPRGIGKELRVIAFAQGDKAEEARKAGASEVGGEDLAKRIEGGWLDFDVAVASPDMMRVVGKLGRVLGPQGKMPSPKAGTVTPNVADAVREFKAGKVGVRADYRPWGFRNPAGEFVGMEIEMVKDVAATLGVKPEFVPVVAANRMQFLAQGQIDLMIATMSDTAERRRVVGIVHPNYYSSGFNVLLPKQVTTTDWNALRGIGDFNELYLHREIDRAERR